MNWFQKQKIRLEKIERVILPNIFQRFCLKCRIERIFISAEQATLLTGLTSRQIFRLVEFDAVHFFENEEGFLFICEDSLNELSPQQIILETTNCRQITE